VTRDLQRESGVSKKYTKRAKECDFPRSVFVLAYFASEQLIFNRLKTSHHDGQGGSAFTTRLEPWLVFRLEFIYAQFHVFSPVLDSAAEGCACARPGRGALGKALARDCLAQPRGPCRQQVKL
jgi:hypothetical protein